MSDVPDSPAASSGSSDADPKSTGGSEVGERQEEVVQPEVADANLFEGSPARGKAWGELIHTLEGHEYWTGGLAFHHDNRILVSGSADNTVRVWDVKTGVCLKVLRKQKKNVRSVHFLGDTGLFAVGCIDRNIRIFDLDKNYKRVKTFKKRTWYRRRGHREGITSVAYFPEKDVLASGSGDYTVKLWNVTSGKLLATLVGHKDWVNFVRFSSDGSYLASGSRDNTIKIWDMKSGTLARTLEGHTGDVREVRFSPVPGSSQLASCSYDGSIRIWDFKNGRTLHVYGDHPDNVLSVVFTPDGKQVLSGCRDGCIRIFETDPTGDANGAVETWNAHTGGVSGLAVSPDGSMLASGSYDNTLKLWRI